MGIHQSSVSRIICKDLHLKCFRKCRADANCAARMKCAKLLLQKFLQSLLTLSSLETTKCFRSLHLTVGRTTMSPHSVTQGSAALPLTACCAVAQRSAASRCFYRRKYCYAFICLNISSIPLIHKGTQHTQLHA